MGKQWGGTLAAKARASLALQLPTACWRCGRMVTEAMRWDVGHLVDVSDRPDLMADPNVWAVEHAHCNRSAGGRKGRAMQAPRRLRRTSKAW